MPLELRTMTCRGPWRRPLLLLLLLLAVVCSVASGVLHQLGDADFDEFIDDLPEETLLLVDFYQVGWARQAPTAVRRTLESSRMYRKRFRATPAPLSSWREVKRVCHVHVWMCFDALVDGFVRRSPPLLGCFVHWAATARTTSRQLCRSNPG